MLDFWFWNPNVTNEYICQPGSSVMVVNSIASVVVFNSLVVISDTANGLPKTTNNATNPPIKAKSITAAKPNLSDLRSKHVLSGEH